MDIDYIYRGSFLTAAGVALCLTLGVSPCREHELVVKWFEECGKTACGGFYKGCPNNMAGLCADGAYECVHIADFQTIGSLEKYRLSGVMDGPGGKSYLCRPRGTPTS